MKAKRPKAVKVWLWTDEDGGLSSYGWKYFTQPPQSERKGREGYRPYLVKLGPVTPAPKPSRKRKEKP